MKTDLKTVPSFVFYQGDPFAEEPDSEYPIEVGYYYGSIGLSQNGNEILLSNEHFKALFREIARHFNDAQSALTSKNK